MGVKWIACVRRLMLFQQFVDAEFAARVLTRLDCTFSTSTWHRRNR
ncbi:hypothetical protein OAF34_02370 [Pirellulaceae bacterium]|nr:hypothetical protein [Pirellulaceae bacterium]